MKNEQSLLGVTSQSFIKNNTQVAEPQTKYRQPKKGGDKVTAPTQGGRGWACQTPRLLLLEFNSNFNLQVSLV